MFSDYTDDDLLDLASFLIKNKFDGDDWEAVFSRPLNRLLEDIWSEARSRDKNKNEIIRIQNIFQNSANEHLINKVVGSIDEMVRFGRMEKTLRQLRVEFDIAIWPFDTGEINFEDIDEALDLVLEKYK